MSRLTWRGRAFLLVGLAAVLAAGIIVANVDFDEVFGKDLPYSLCPDSRSVTKATIPSQMSEEAAGYRGPGPHHVHIDQFGDPEYGGRNFRNGETSSGLPKEWLVPIDGGQYVFDTLKLVVCEYQYAVGDQGMLGPSCSYQDTSGTTYQFTPLSARYYYRVYEAATGELLTEFDVEGDAGSADCVDRTWVYPEMATTLAAVPDIAELTRRLKPLVERDVP